MFALYRDPHLPGHPKTSTLGQAQERAARELLLGCFGDWNGARGWREGREGLGPALSVCLPVCLSLWARVQPSPSLASPRSCSRLSADWPPSPIPFSELVFCFSFPNQFR